MDQGFIGPAFQWTGVSLDRFRGPAEAAHLRHDDVHLSAKFLQRVHQLFGVAMDPHPAAVDEDLRRAVQHTTATDIRPAKSTGLPSRLLGFFYPIYRSTGW